MKPATDEPNRWTPIGPMEMEADEHGEYVAFEDYAQEKARADAAEQRNAELEAALREGTKLLDEAEKESGENSGYFQDCVSMKWYDANERLKKALRND